MHLEDYLFLGNLPERFSIPAPFLSVLVALLRVLVSILKILLQVLRLHCIHLLLLHLEFQVLDYMRSDPRNSNNEKSHKSDT